MDMECDAVELENGMTYIIIKELMYNNSKYVLLSNENNVKDIAIRRSIMKDDKEYLEGIESNEELDKIISEFTKFE